MERAGAPDGTKPLSKDNMTPRGGGGGITGKGGGIGRGGGKSSGAKGGNGGKAGGAGKGGESNHARRFEAKGRGAGKGGDSRRGRGGRSASSSAAESSPPPPPMPPPPPPPPPPSQPPKTRAGPTPGRAAAPLDPWAAFVDLRIPRARERADTQALEPAEREANLEAQSDEQTAVLAIYERELTVISAGADPGEGDEGNSEPRVIELRISPDFDGPAPFATVNVPIGALCQTRALALALTLALDPSPGPGPDPGPGPEPWP